MMLNNSRNWRNYLLPLMIIGIIYFALGFGVGISGILIPFLQDAFELSKTQSYLVTTAIFSAFVIFGAPSGYIIKKFGYRISMVIAFAIMALGMALFAPSATSQNFSLFLLALFVGGIGNTLLQAAVNPFISIIGPTESAAMRLSLMGIMNKTAWWLGPLFLGLFLDMNNVVLANLIFPFLLVAGIMLALGVFVWFMPLPEVKAAGEDDNDATQEQLTTTKTSVWQFPHLLLGVLAIFIYVGVETLPMASVLDFARMALPGHENIDRFATLVPVGLVAGYLFGVALIPKYLSQTVALKIFALIGIVSSIALILLPAQYAIFAMPALGFANSLMWPAIWPLAISGLGKFTKTGSSLLVMGIVGGAILPLLFGWILDISKTGEQLTVQNYQNAYWLFVPGYLYILFYALKGYKIGK